MRITKDILKLKKATGEEGRFAMHCLSISPIDESTVRIVATGGVLAVICTVSSPGHGVSRPALIPAKILKTEMVGGWLEVDESTTILYQGKKLVISTYDQARYPDISAAVAFALKSRKSRSTDTSELVLAVDVLAKIAAVTTGRIRMFLSGDEGVIIFQSEEVGDMDITGLAMPITGDRDGEPRIKM